MNASVTAQGPSVLLQHLNNPDISNEAGTALGGTATDTPASF
ncbi:MAG: hypothetical protein AB7E81_03330 [Hyphomicrobiaceae bacterium]